MVISASKVSILIDSFANATDRGKRSHMHARTLYNVSDDAFCFCRCHSSERGVRTRPIMLKRSGEFLFFSFQEGSTTPRKCSRCHNYAVRKLMLIISVKASKCLRVGFFDLEEYYIKRLEILSLV